MTEDGGEIGIKSRQGKTVRERERGVERKI